MDKKILIGIAEAILEAAKGDGYWMVNGEPEWDTDGAMTGLSVGDVVYTYSEDDSCLLPVVVHDVLDGVGYTIEHMGKSYRPRVSVITEDAYSRTEAGACKIWRKAILHDAEYHAGMARTSARAKSLLGDL